MRDIKEIIVHCEATPEGENFTPAQVDLCHKQRKFTPYKGADGKTHYIGYHYVIGLDGTVTACRPEWVKGCHCTGHNSNSIGISYVGGCVARTVPNWQKKPKDTRTPAQKKALEALVRKLMAKYPGATVHGHDEFADKACPSFDVKAWLREIGIKQ